jgi:hypothetical protein
VTGPDRPAVLSEAEIDRVVRRLGYRVLRDTGGQKIWANPAAPAGAKRAVTVPSSWGRGELEGKLRQWGLVRGGAELDRLLG